ncbi:MAG TPA: response regulator [Roseiflexaceae bacterium]|nr:response regulator [Roseiflexaceae bacterium]
MNTILLVEDNEMNRDMICQYLRYHGYIVLCAENGEEAVALAEHERPNVILMDISLPLTDGLEATRRIKARPATSAIPVIALSAHAMPADRQASIDAGCDDYESKPINFARLLSKIRAAGVATTDER